MKLSAKTVSISTLIRLFGDQASRAEGSFGDRRLVGHLMGDSLPTTQAVFQAARKAGGELQLIDGHKRLFRWMQMRETERPFDEVVLVTHEVDAARTVDLKSKMSALRRSIDSRDSLNRTVDEYTQAVLSAGLKMPQSRAYRRGVKAEDYFRRVIGQPTEAYTALVAKVVPHLSVHIFMDNLFRMAEKAKLRDRYLTPGIAVGLFQLLADIKHSSEMQAAIVKAYNDLENPEECSGVGLSHAIFQAIKKVSNSAELATLAEKCGLMNKQAIISETAAELKNEILKAMRKSRKPKVKTA